MKITNKFFAVLALLVFVGLPVGGRAFGEDVTLTVSPELPGSRETVRVSLQSYNFDLDRSTISWRVNGREAKSGLGEKVFSFETGAPGARLDLNVTVRTPENAVLTRALAFAPQEVDLLWKAETHVPPFYRGKALPAYEAPIVVTAVPHVFVSGKRAAPSALVYNWTVNDRRLPEASGYGKSSLRLVGPGLFAKVTVAVEVQIAAGEAAARREIILQPARAAAVFYIEDPLEGPFYGRALSGTAALSPKAGGLGVRVEPFFFTLADLGVLSYAWRVNGLPAPNRERSPFIMFESEGGGGVSHVTLEVANDRSLLQTVRTSLLVNLGD